MISGPLYEVATEDKDFNDNFGEEDDNEQMKIMTQGDIDNYNSFWQFA